MQIGIGGAVFLIFLALKLTHIQPVCEWSWVWITSPLWIGLLVAIIMWTVAGAIFVAVKSKR